jgi:hypothetical protein
MRIAVSTVVPTRSAISWRESAMGMKTPFADFCPIRSASVEKRRPIRRSIPPVMSAIRRLSAMSRIVSPASRRRVISGRFSRREKNSRLGIEITPHGSSATAVAGNGRRS